MKVVQELIYHPGPWQVLQKITNVLCSDFKFRTANVTGFVWMKDGQYLFTANKFNKNHNLLPEW
jgi:hypothetical protein